MREQLEALTRLFNGGLRYRARCASVATVSGKGNEMENPDISIIYSEDSTNWHRYILECFMQIPETENNRPKVKSIAIEHQELPLAARDAHALSDSSVQLVILSPSFLDYIEQNENVFHIGRLLDSEKIVAMLCGVEASDITRFHKEALVSYDSWKNKLSVVDQDKNFVLKILRKSAELLSAGCEEQWRRDSYIQPQFRITPRRIKESKTKIYIMLNDPIMEVGNIKVIIECGVRNERICQEVTFKVLNPYTLQFKISDSIAATSSLINVHVYCDELQLGTQSISCFSRMGELAHLLHTMTSSPVDFMCQALGLNPENTNEIDDYLANSLKKYELGQGKLSVLDFNLDDTNLNFNSHEKMPTFLHFAAQYGFYKLCSSLLDCIGATIACQIRNVHGQTPAEIASSAGHTRTADLLEDFQTFCEVAEIYQQIKQGSSGIEQKQEESNSTEVAEMVENTPSYQNRRTYENVSPPVPPARIMENVEYVEMTGSKANISSMTNLEPHKKMLLGIQHSVLFDSAESSLCSEARGGIDETSDGYLRANGRVNIPNSQYELIEILEEYKRKNYSLNEVELLYKNWLQNQKASSFKEKEDQLMRMRKNYEAVQLKNQSERKNTKIEKCRQFFSTILGKNNKMDRSLSEMEISGPIIKKSPDLDTRKTIERRSNWRLSTTSSTSSTSVDRISCFSHDSGNHSDAIGDESQSNRRKCRRSNHLTESLSMKQRMSKALLDPKYVEKVSASSGPQLPKRNQRSEMDASWASLSKSRMDCCWSDDGVNDCENTDSFGYVLPDIISSYSSHGTTDSTEKPPIPQRNTSPKQVQNSIFYDDVCHSGSSQVSTSTLIADDYIEMTPDGKITGTSDQRINETQCWAASCKEYRRKCFDDNTELLTNIHYVSMNSQGNTCEEDKIPMSPPPPPRREKHDSSQKPALPPKCPIYPINHSGLPPKPIPISRYI